MRNTRIGVEAVEIRVRKFLRFDEQMPVLRAARSQRCKRLSRQNLWYACGENIQGFVRSKALRGRRQFEQTRTVIRRVDGLHPFSAIGCEIGERHRAAERARLRYDGARDLAAVENAATVLLQQPERMRERGIAKHLPFTRPSTVDVPRTHRIRIELRAAASKRERVG